MSKRNLTALVMLIVGFPVLLIGGIPYLVVLSLMLVAAAWEFAEMYRAASTNGQAHRPAGWLVAGAVAVLAVMRFYHSPYGTTFLTFAILALLAYHLVDFERGAPNSGLDFCISLAALIYLGWVGSYLLDLRQLDNGGWWIMFVLPCVWMSDTGAYLIGSAYGRHKLAPRLSPKKSWEGYVGGAVSALLIGAVLAYAYSVWGPLHLPVWVGAVFGLVVGLLTPLGDLGESMLKRQAGLKDSGKIFPGHGGAFDRIDSWIWAAVLGFYFIQWFAS